MLGPTAELVCSSPSARGLYDVEGAVGCSWLCSDGAGACDDSLMLVLDFDRSPRLECFVTVAELMAIPMRLIDERIFDSDPIQGNSTGTTVWNWHQVRDSLGESLAERFSAPIICHDTAARRKSIRT